MKLSNKVLRVLHRRTGIGRPSYVYRNLQALSGESSNAWFISGYDRYNGKRGILEWCHHEVDARHLLEEMRQFPGQFEALNSEQYSEVDWLRTTWDTHY